MATELFGSTCRAEDQMPENIQQLRKQAEAAVGDMSDGEMKVKAFEVILGHLLATGGQASQAPAKVPRAKPSVSKQDQKEMPRNTRGDRILFLHTEGFFAIQRSLAEVQTELRRNGWHYPVTALSGPLQKLVQQRQLRREQVKDGNRTIWKYSNY
jgi:hypothetical protein